MTDRKEAGRGQTPAPCFHSLFIAFRAQSAIGNRSQQPRRRGDLAAEAAADRIIGEKVLRVLLAHVSGDVEVGIKKQRVTGRDGIGYHAECRRAIVAMMYRGALELLPDRGGLLAA